MMVRPAGPDFAISAPRKMSEKIFRLSRGFILDPPDNQMPLDGVVAIVAVGYDHA